MEKIKHIHPHPAADAGCPTGSCPHCSGHDHSFEEASPKAEAIRLTISLIFFALGIIFRSKLQASPYRIGEYVIFLIPYLTVGYGVILSALRNLINGKLFDENFLMTVATFGAIALGEMPEAAAVMLFYTIGEMFQERAASSARRSIQALTDIRPDTTYLVSDSQGSDPRKTDPLLVEPGSLVLVRPGERVPLDGIIVSGNSFFDTSALTGESVPVRVEPGSQALAGSVNGQGLLIIETTARYGDSSLARIIKLVEEAAERKAPTERFITRFARVYTPAVVGAALLIALLPPLLLADASFAEWIRRALILLVVSCPCALVISIPLGYFGGIGGASAAGILIKGANYLETLAELDTVVFDKTGTLTEGVFEVSGVYPEKGYSREELLGLAAFAESHSNHPIAGAIRRAAETIPSEFRIDASLNTFEEIAGKGVRAEWLGKPLLAGNQTLLRENNIPSPPPVEKDKGEAASSVLIAYGENYIGTIAVSDRIREDAAGLVTALHGKGIRHTVMLTGDSETGAKAVAEKLGLDSYYAKLLPDEKLSKLEEIMASPRTYKRTAFVGDGINDAPVLSRADVGIAMGGIGSDAAIEAADVVLMDDKPSNLATAITGAKRTRGVVLQNIIFSLGIKGLVILLGIFGLASMWMAIFADVGVALLAILNSTRVLKMFKA
ncbi:heavy metal translocating P-type ATPase [Sediminispirochaeta smaragdinae]|uniref:P-type Zn(2+) transporter n=1 Tax=Sediminispirochaeta smaragdinae (strain DSM 11293 / JCM 15392 / SEBR 4228) TaxID=573413 RepID=E1R2L5_SEDSS|nr:heavy metal translocating P-type ATPase [Sediminispirochaeta smaragdinae]ADK82575.1 heavy metal translocating P-type ATPase [Sediminispirochaeta smaragdinae DSM 11293]